MVVQGSNLSKLESFLFLVTPDLNMHKMKGGGVYCCILPFHSAFPGRKVRMEAGSVINEHLKPSTSTFSTLGNFLGALKALPDPCIFLLALLGLLWFCYLKYHSICHAAHPPWASGSKLCRFLAHLPSLSHSVSIICFGRGCNLLQLAAL